MTVILFELRKIFEWKRVLVTTIFCVVFYFLFLEFHFSFFPNGRPELDAHRIGIEMIENFGPGMSADELIEFQNQYEQEVERFNEYIQGRADFQEAGITTYEQFQQIHWDAPEYELRRRLFFDEGVDLVWELEQREWFISFFDTTVEQITLRENQQHRHLEIINREEQAILPWLILLNYQNIIVNTAAMVIVSVAIMLSPVYIKERKNKMLIMQYSTKLGRKLFLSKILATLIATLIMVSIQVGAIMLLYRGNETSMFFSVDISSVWNITMSWFDITFGNYILLTIGLVYALALSIALMVNFLGRLSPNYLVIFGVQVPIFAVFLNVLLEYMVRIPLQTTIPKLLAPSLYMGLIVLIGIITIFHWRREQKIDIFN